MKPLKLTLEAFGSYGKREVIDFTKTSQNLFLVTGDTGSGKTTIFDGIVFALYGEACSSYKKEGMLLQSQFAGLDVVPTVTLEFADGQGDDARIYKVTRCPRHEEPKKRKGSTGSLTNDVAETVSLIMPDGTEYPKKETNQKLEEIVGLSKKQFMQVAMIAQGEFMDLIRQDTKDKKPIFRQLFKTELYDEIKNKLDQRTKEAERELAIIKTECVNDAVKLQFPAGFITTEEYDKLYQAIIEGKLAEADKFVSELSRMIDKLSEKIEDEIKTLNLKKDIYDRAKDEYSKIEELFRYYQIKDNNQRLLAKCEEEKKEIEEMIALSEKLRHSYEIKQVYDVVQALLKDYQDEKKKDEEERKRNPLLVEALAAAGKDEEDKKLKYDEAARNFHMVKEKVRKSKDVLDKKKEAVKEFNRISQVVEENKKVLAKDIAERDKLDDIEKKATEDMKETASWEAKKKNLEYRISEYNAIKELFEEYKKQDLELNQTSEELLDNQNKYKEANDEFVNISREYEEQDRIYNDSQAGILARNLFTGFPCPVCGSLEHPNPCKFDSDFQVLERHELLELKNKSEKKREIRDKLSSKCYELKLKKENYFESKERTVVSINDRLSAIIPVEGSDVSTLYLAFKDFKGMLAREKADIDEEEARYKKAMKTLSNMEDKRKGTELIIQNGEERLKANTLLLENCKATIESYAIQTEYESLEAADEAASEAGLHYANAEEAYKKATAFRAKTESDKIESDTLIAKYQEELPEKRERGNQKYQEYTELLEKYELSEESFKELTHNYGRSKIDEWQKRINNHNANLASAKEMLANAENLIAGREKPDIDTITEKVSVAKAAVEVEEDMVSSLKAILNLDKVVYDSFYSKAATRTGKVRIAGKYRELYNMVAGKNTGKRMDLETFVLRTYLDQILKASNRRLYNMTSGQYELRMVDIDKASEGSNKGLNLMVYSFVTDKQRDIKTLSGGESFMAALSLALGMADQIQADTSAVNLDIMFLDEGFGSLDDHSRNEAVKVLKQMAYGSKLIGIISHVSELKTEIEDQLVVTKDETGSHVKWQNG